MHQILDRAPDEYKEEITLAKKDIWDIIKNRKLDNKYLITVKETLQLGWKDEYAKKKAKEQL